MAVIKRPISRRYKRTKIDVGNERPDDIVEQPVSLPRPRARPTPAAIPQPIQTISEGRGILGQNMMGIGLSLGRQVASGIGSALSRPRPRPRSTQQLAQSADPGTAGAAQDALDIEGRGRAIGNVTQGNARFLAPGRTSAGGVAGVGLGDHGSVAPIAPISRPRTAANNAYGSAPISRQTTINPTPQRPQENIVADTDDLGVQGAAPITQQDVIDRMRPAGKGQPRLTFEQARQAIINERRAQAQQRVQNQASQDASSLERRKAEADIELTRARAEEARRPRQPFSSYANDPNADLKRRKLEAEVRTLTDRLPEAVKIRVEQAHDRLDGLYDQLNRAQRLKALTRDKDARAQLESEATGIQSQIAAIESQIDGWLRGSGGQATANPDPLGILN